ncbi:hypothetical protein MKW94_028842 [Papaver nudicaule]|uniref:Acidic protein n=1 Tax=Papaver nudicaule TaxID=74823 RepID=A0AA41SCM0_PAPNU|nr:hypothetical protein [Papaver nudicaule]
MEGKYPALISVMMIGVILMGLFLAQTPMVDGLLACCQNAHAKRCLIHCRTNTRASRGMCTEACSCVYKNEYGGVKEEDTNDFCKLGCASSVCSHIIALHKSAEGIEEAVKEAVERCNSACYQLCDKK